MRRLSSGLDRIVDLVPAQAELQAAHDVVRDDLPDDAHLVDLVGAAWGHDVPLSRRAAMPRVRPILVALAARAAGASQVEGEPLYAAELLHLALVVHDLALGRQGGRRRRVARKVVKRSVSWLGGNHLTLRALELCRHTSPEVLSELVDTLRCFSDGQELARELQQAGVAPTLDDWLEHADAHTAALFAFCCRAGGHIAGADPAVLSALGRYGRHFGRLWHVAEDLSALDHGDAPAHLLARASVARPVLAVVTAAERDPALGDAWVRLVAEPRPVLAEALAPTVRDLGRRGAREVMLRESWAARKALRAVPDSRYRAAMDKLAAGLAR